MKLLELIDIKNHAINLIENKQTLTGPVYKLDETKNFKNLY